ncbi:hypothetical protein [Streptomyces sp. NPDC046161]|uniref:hypothetical protein n=1 Tax=Streptomyces sp. NPDC046161 TaxID=3155132 RepID=UPI00340FE684
MSSSTDGVKVSQTERLERLRTQMRGRPVGPHATARTAPAPATGLLYGVMLRGAARVEAGLELTELEERMVSFLRTMMSEEEVRAFGRVYQEEQVAGPSPLFPAALADRDIERGYAFEDLVEDLPGLRGQVMAQPNMGLVDLDRLPEGADLDSAEFAESLAAYGHAVTVVTASSRLTDVGTASTTENVAIALDRFRCTRASQEPSRDEIYWALSAASDTGTKQTSITREYGEVITGSISEFDDGTMLFNGPVNRFLTARIICWEADHSPGDWLDKMREAMEDISDLLFKLSDALAAYGGHFPVPQYHDLIDYVEIAGMIGMVITWLIDLFTNHDDLVAERTIVLDRAALAAWIERGGLPQPVDEWLFNGGTGGLFLLETSATGGVDTHLRVTSAPSAPDTIWSPDTALPSSMALGGAPALAAFNDRLLCVSRGARNDSAVYWSMFDGNTWSTFLPVPGVQGVQDLALATHPISSSRTYCVYRSENKLHLMVFDGTSWTYLGTHSQTARDTPALTFYGSELLCVVRSVHSLNWAKGSAESFASWTFQTLYDIATCGAPALGSTGDTTYLVARSGDGCRRPVESRFEGTGWGAITALTAPGPVTDTTAALAPNYGKLHCVIRSADKSQELLWSRFIMGDWSPIQKHPTATAGGAPALAYVPPGAAAGPDAPYGRLYCVYRG